MDQSTISPDVPSILAEDYHLAEVKTRVQNALTADVKMIGEDFNLVYLYDLVEPYAEIDQISYFVANDVSARWFGEDSFEFDAEATSIELENLFLPNANQDADADSLHSEATALYNKANKAYLAMDGHKYPFIKINSGLRDSTKQAKLYIAYIRSLYGGPAAPRANKPGTSNHEFGVAIDVFRKLDEARLRQALTGASWSNDVADEGWHFDATGITSWSKIQKAKSTIKSTLSDPFGNLVASFFELAKKINENYPQWKAERDRLEQEQQRLLKEQNFLKGRANELKNWQSNLKRKIDRFDSDVESLSRLRDRINNFRYTYCPNGNPFDSCSHTAEKRRYVNERNAMVQDHNNRARELQQRKRDIEREASRFRAEVNQFNARARQFEGDANAWKTDVERNNKLAQRIQGWVDRMENIKKEVPTKVSEIESAVDSVRRGMLVV